MTLIECETEQIERAYRKQIRRFYDTLLSALISAGDRELSVQAAQQRFVAGVQLARRTRAMAIANLPALTP